MLRRHQNIEYVEKNNFAIYYWWVCGDGRNVWWIFSEVKGEHVAFIKVSIIAIHMVEFVAIWVQSYSSWLSVAVSRHSAIRIVTVIFANQLPK